MHTAEITADAPRATRREWTGLAVLALACLLYSMDLTVLHLAVPKLSAALRPSSAQLLWIIDVYGFLIAGSLITMGTLGDRIGRRRLLLIGAAAFSITSVIAAFSTSPGMLIASRALMGVAGATLAPSTLSLIFSMFLDPGERTVAIGIWISSFSAGGVIGPLLGGALLEYFWWGSVFLLALPVMALLLVLGPRVLPEFRDPEARRLDLRSAGMSLAAVLAVIYGLKEIAQDGLGLLPTLFIVAGLAVGVLFVRRQLTLADPMIDLRLFRIPSFSTSLAAYMLGIFVAFGYFLFIPQYLQLVLGLSPLQSGLWTAPAMGAFIVGSTLAPQIVRRVRPAFVMGTGLALSAVALTVLAVVGGFPTLPVLVTVGVVSSLGLAPVFTLATDLIVGSAPPERAGAASGISETSAELGGALGIAILGSIGTAVYRSELANRLPAGIPSEVAAIARNTLGGAVNVAEQLPQQLGLALLDIARSAFVRGLHVAVAVGAAVAIAAAIATVVLLRRVPVRSQVEPGQNLDDAGGTAASGPTTLEAPSPSQQGRPLEAPPEAGDTRRASDRPRRRVERDALPATKMTTTRLPDAVRALFDGPNYAHIATVLPDGGPHTVPVWVGLEGNRIAFLTGPGSRKARNLERDPRVAISIIVHNQPYAMAQVRGRVAARLEGEAALAIIDRMSHKYTGQPYPMRTGRVVFLIEPERARARVFG